jgi:hypothetical protein
MNMLDLAALANELGQNLKDYQATAVPDDPKRQDGPAHIVVKTKGLLGLWARSLMEVRPQNDGQGFNLKYLDISPDEKDEILDEIEELDIPIPVIA